MHFDCTCCFIARSWICVDVQSCIAHITYIVEMKTVENSTYQVSVADNVHSSSHLTRNLSGCYVYLFLSKLIYVDLQCTSSLSPSVGMYWVIYVTEYHKRWPPIGYVSYDLWYLSTSEMHITTCHQVYHLVRNVSTWALTVINRISTAHRMHNWKSRLSLSVPTGGMCGEGLGGWRPASLELIVLGVLAPHQSMPSSEI